ncbi:Peptidase A1 [Macleaya cordata]|uniref:Peptidase A1 n=1 Tax=Macleaya cordata TaxID=56857 RepID=A0A200Q098_MACCD|nr:Peptidase A1 [Macleaya cordata]
MIFGCGHNNYDPAGDNAPGMMGLNRKALSFISQLAYDHFSYCLVVKNATSLSSKIHFGLSAVITDGTTPILDEGNEEFYYLSLEGISVGKNRLQIPAGSFNVTPEGHGGFIIDSGSTYSEIKSDVFALLIAELEKQIDLERLTSPTGELCYKCKFEDIAPDITFHFTGVDIVLSKLSTWVNGGEGILCLGMLAVDGGQSVLGNHQQQNLNVGYDLNKKIISFKSMDCTNT